jgi:hypothetical protein
MRTASSGTTMSSSGTRCNSLGIYRMLRAGITVQRAAALQDANERCRRRSAGSTCEKTPASLRSSAQAEGGRYNGEDQAGGHGVLCPYTEHGASSARVIPSIRVVLRETVRVPGIVKSLVSSLPDHGSFDSFCRSDTHDYFPRSDTRDCFSMFHTSDACDWSDLESRRAECFRFFRVFNGGSTANSADAQRTCRRGDLDCGGVPST